MTDPIYAVTNEAGKTLHITPLYRVACETAKTWAVMSGQDRIVKPLTTDEEMYNAYYEMEIENG